MDTNVTSPKHSHLLAAAVSIGATICAATAGAAYGQPMQRTEIVGIADLDLSTADGARMFLKRLDIAAQRACGFEPVRSPLLPRESGRFEQCVREAVETAVNSTGEPVVLALHSETPLSGGTALASR